eukprot:753263-Hanusia_phi.AAC.6
MKEGSSSVVREDSSSPKNDADQQTANESERYAGEVDTLLRKEKLYPDLCFMIAKGRHAFRSYRIDGEAIEQMKRSQDKFSQDPIHRLRYGFRNSNLKYLKIARPVNLLFSASCSSQKCTQRGMETSSVNPALRQERERSGHSTSEAQDQQRSAERKPPAKTNKTKPLHPERPRRTKLSSSKKQLRRLDKSGPGAISQEKPFLEKTNLTDPSLQNRSTLPLTGRQPSGSPEAMCSESETRGLGDEVVASWKEINRSSLSPITRIKISSANSILEDSHKADFADSVQCESSESMRQLVLPAPHTCLQANTLSSATTRECRV